MATEPVDLTEAYQWSVPRLASATGFSRELVRSALGEAGVNPTGLQRQHAGPQATVYPAKDALAAIYARHYRVNVTEPDYSLERLPKKPLDRKLFLESESQRVDLEQRLRLLIPIDEYRDRISSLLQSLASGLEELPAHLEQRLQLDPEIVDAIDMAIDDYRSMLVSAQREALISESPETDGAS